MEQHKKLPVSERIRQHAHINAEQYETMYQQSIENPESFWGEQAKQFLHFSKLWKNVFEGTLTKAKWFKGATLNACYNCIDRHLAKHANQTAIIWEGDDARDSFSITYQDLHERVCQLANVLKKNKIKKGSRVCIYMPMIPEAAIAMLACARIGAIHSVVFGGFSSRALQDRLEDASCELVITADEGVRGEKHIPLKASVDAAVEHVNSVKTVIVVRRTGKKIHWNNGRDIWYHQAIQEVPKECPVEEMAAEDPLFILYTSGSTGKPKGVLHTTAGYLLYAAMTHKYVFDYHPGDIYWCTADVGWITGHSYIVYGPLVNAATTLMFEGMPNSPTPARAWEVIDKHQVNIFYTAPTAIRSLMREGNEFVTKTSRKSLRILGSVGEPINPEAWEWYFNVVGEGRCPIIDTWWQTETGGIMITPLPGISELKPGSANKPFFGVQVALIDEKGQIIKGEGTGKLLITHSWPGQMRDLYNNHSRFLDTYFKEFPGQYYTGDGASRDADGDYWITGRLDDVINVSGHRIGTAEVESALVLHSKVTEAALVGIPDKIRGSNLYVFVTLKADEEGSDELKEQLRKLVAQEIGAIAKPRYIQFCSDLPKTRSGKIMRRILRCIACNEIDKIGDTSTLGNPDIIDELLTNRLDTSQ